MAQESTKRPRWQIWTGRVLSALVVLPMLFSGAMKLSHAAQVLAMWGPKFGYPESLLTPIGVVEVLCALLYAIPKTRIFGAVLVAAYLGGAVATHVRIGDVFITPLLLGVMAWIGAWLHDDRFRAFVR